MRLMRMLLRLPRMMTMILALVLVAGCSETYSAGIFGREAGAQIDEGSFGKPSDTNRSAMLAYREADGSVIDLGRRFAAAVPDTVNFAFNSAELDAEARAILARQAAWIRSNDNILFRVTGHTDLVGGERYNLHLGQRRARAVVGYLISQGVPQRRLQAVTSRGKAEPIVRTPEPERANRRAVTQVVGTGRGFVGSDLDGKYAARVYSGYVRGGAAGSD